MHRYKLRYNPISPNGGQPATSREARQALLDGNRRFADWMIACRHVAHEHDHAASVEEHPSELVVPCGGLSSILEFAPHEYPTQKPFAVVVGCSDARVPTEMVFGQGYNDLFVVRNAGNVISDVLVGSIDFTLHALADSVRAIVVLGHTSCGAVRGAVDAYLNPAKYWSKTTSPNLRLIFQRIFVAVREADDMIHEIWGPDAATQPGYYEALKETTVCLNAAHSAYELRREVEAEASGDLDVFYAVYDVRTHLVRTPTRPEDLDPEGRRELTYAPNHPRELTELAREVATALQPGRAGSLAPDSDLHGVS